MAQDFAVQSRPTVIVAENPNGFCRFPYNLLRNSGYRVLEALHGHEALYLAHRNADTLKALVAQLDLPRMGGWELAAHVLTFNREVRTIVLTPGEAWSTVGSREVCLPENSSPEDILRAVRGPGNPVPATKPDLRLRKFLSGSAVRQSVLHG